MVQSTISKAKAKSLSAKQFLEDVEDKIRANAQMNGGYRLITDDIDLVVADIYKDYEKTLRCNNSLDFDDLLVYGLRLFKDYPKAAKWCKHVLVDEL